MDSPKSEDLELQQFLDSNKDQGRTMLLPALIKTQKRFGHIPKKQAAQIGEVLRVPLADISGVIEFYSMLHNQPTGNKIVGICTSPVCAAKGAHHLHEEIIEKTRGDHLYVEKVACLGICDHAPAAIVNETQIGNANVDTIFQQKSPCQTSIYGNPRLLTQNCFPDRKPSIQSFIENEGFKGLERALDLTPVQVIETIKASGLKGRGGAGFPTGLKWEGAAQAKSEVKYVICNADESEPGTIKDRALLLGDPFRILEGMLISAYAVGAQKGYCYIRGEYPEAFRVMESAIIQAYQEGYLGNNILGRDFDFHLELRRGAGAYICGEETALFESIEGKRGFPRIKPPFPTTHGLFGKPTVINNVETFVNIPLIVNLGVENYKNLGSPSVPGPRLFSLSGDINRPGVYEVTKPTTIKELIFEWAGGIPNQADLQSILLGGAAGKFIGPNAIDLLLTEEALRQEELTLGSGAIMVFDTTRDMREILASLGHFFAHESCGKCYPCQMGTQRQVEILERNRNGGLLPGDLSRLQDVGWTMTDSSLCGLGQTASLAILSAVKLWPELLQGDNLTQK